ncbi:hypothetical protein DENSPDRAFT_784275, partial [Dentipellis sp. KUC8613]
LRCLFERLTWLLNVNFTPIFVFDGPGCVTQVFSPAASHEQMLAIREGFMRLISAFGFPWRQVCLDSTTNADGNAQAPGDADAELARCQIEGLLDVVVSHDGRALLFGAFAIVSR